MDDSLDMDKNTTSSNVAILQQSQSQSPKRQKRQKSTKTLSLLVFSLGTVFLSTIVNIFVFSSKIHQLLRNNNININSDDDKAQIIPKNNYLRAGEYSYHKNDEGGHGHRCLSPESNSPWVLDSTCSEEQFFPSFSSSSNEPRSCGLCGEQTSHLRSLRDDIANRFEQKCKDLVVYGAAFGQSYEDWLQNPESVDERDAKIVEKHGTCFFQFILDYNNTGHTHSIDGSQNLIIVKEEWLP